MKKTSVEIALVLLESSPTSNKRLLDAVDRFADADHSQVHLLSLRPAVLSFYSPWMPLGPLDISDGRPAEYLPSIDRRFYASFVQRRGGIAELIQAIHETRADLLVMDSDRYQMFGARRRELTRDLPCDVFLPSL